MGTITPDIAMLMLESSEDCLWMMDATGRHLYTNYAAERVLGYSVEDFMERGEALATLVHPGDQKALRSLLEGALATHEAWSGEVFRWRAKDGSYRWFESNSSPMFDAGGAIVGFCGVDRDITRRVEREREQLESTQRLEQARRIDSLGRITTTVANEVNNALMVIGPAAEVIARRFAHDSDVARFAEQILGGVRRGKRVTQQILRFSRPAEPARKRIGMKQWLTSITPELSSLAGAHVRLRTSCSDRTLAADVDCDQLHQVLTNLVANARDAMHTRGRIEISVAREASDMIEIVVRDDGPGIPANIIRRVFEPLFTTKLDGNGIGLPLCQQIVVAHGGSMTLESNGRCGTTVRVLLPSKPMIEAPRPTAVVIEDDELVAAALTSILETVGYDTHWSRNAEDLSDLAGKADLMLLDIQLGDTDGREVFAELRRRAIDVPVILMSGHSHLAMRDLDPRAAFLSKPFGSKELLEAAAAIA